jgi:DNA repair protein SbcD/Mre11
MSGRSDSVAVSIDGGAMRILHTSDWHLGRTLRGVDLLEYQASFIDHLLELVVERNIDVVIVAGDIYDRAMPSVPTVKLLSDALRRLSDVATVVLTPGNHDSAVRVGFAAELMRPNLRILADSSRMHVPLVIPDEHGDVAIYGLPYLDPDTMRGAFSESNEGEPLARSHEAVMRAAMDRVRADLATREGARSVVVAHAFVVGGVASESERDIRVGGVDAVPAEIFEGVNYVALGHLHGPQQVGSVKPVIRYSGSPLAFSFGELSHKKSSAIVELDESGEVTVELVPTRVPRPLAEISGPIEELLDGSRDEYLEAWLRVYVTDPIYPPQMFSRVKEHFPHALIVLHAPDGGDHRREVGEIGETSDPLVVAAEFVEFATGAGPTEDETAAILTAYEGAQASKRSA